MRTRYTGPGKSLGAGALVALLSTAVYAGQLDYGATYSSLLTDNLPLTPDGDPAWVNIGRGLLSYSERSETLEASLQSVVEGRVYAAEDRDYDPEVLFSLNGRATWAVSPRRLTFTVEDVFSPQAPVDPTLAVSVLNRQNINVFSLGPNAYFYPTPATTLEVNARYVNAYYEGATTDNERLTGAARLLRAVSPRTTVSLNYEPTRVDYQDNTLNPDYTREDWFVGLGTRVWDNGLGISLGRTTIARDNAPALDGSLARVTIGRQMTRAASLDLSASREYSDAARATLIVDPSTNVVAPTPTNPSEFVGGGIFYGEAVTALYQYRRDYGVSFVHAFWRELDYEVPLFDQRNHGVFFQLGYDYSADWTASLLGDYANIDYLEVERTDVTKGIGAQLLHRFRRDTSIFARLYRRQRDSDLASQNWQEWRAMIGIGYFTAPAAFATSPFLFNDPIYR